MEGSPSVYLKNYCWNVGKQLLTVFTMDNVAGNHRRQIEQ